MSSENEALENFISDLTTHFLSANEIPDDVVDRGYEGNFAEYSDVDSVAETTTLMDLKFADLLDIVMQKLESVIESGHKEPIFDRLAREGIPAKKLVILLWIAIEEALKNQSDVNSLRKGAYAARAYMLFSCLPGAQAFEIFNRFLYLKALELLRHLYRLIVFRQRMSSSSGTKGKGKRKKSQPIVDNNAEEMQISPREQEACRKIFLYSLDGVYILLQTVSVAGPTDTVQSTGLLLRDAIPIDLNEDTETTVPESFDAFKSRRSISSKCFGILHQLIDDRHGFRENVVMARVLKPRLMCYGPADEVIPTTSAISSHMIAYRDHIMCFLRTRALMTEDVEKEHRMIYKLAQNAFVCPDRSDYRSKVSESVIELLRLVPSKFHYEFVQFLEKVFSQNISFMRSFAIEVLPQFLKAFDLSGPDPGPIAQEHGEEESEDESEEEEMDAEDQDQHAENDDGSDAEEDARPARKAKPKKRRRHMTPPPRLHPIEGPLTILLEAVYDKSSSIRSKALVHLAELFKDSAQLSLIEKICADNMDVEQHAVKFTESGQTYPSPLLLIVLQRCDDEKVVVRKCALLALGSLFPSLTDKDHVRTALKEMSDLARDTSVMVRKQAAETLSEVFRTQPGNEEIRTTWLDAVMPMLIDREQSVQQLASKIVMEVIFAELTSASPGEHVWMLLKDIERDFNVRRLLYRAMMALRDQNLLPQSLVGVMSRHVADAEKSASAWLLLSFLSKIFKVKPKVAYEFWFTLTGEVHATLVPTYVSDTLVQTFHELSKEQIDTLKADLHGRIVRFDILAKNIPSIFYLYAKLHDAVGEGASGRPVFFKLCQRLVTTVSNAICQVLYGKDLKDMPFADEPGSSSHVVFSQLPSSQGVPAPNYQPGDFSEEKVISMLQTVGECVQYEPKTCSSKLAKVFKYIFASDYALSVGEQVETLQRANLVMSELPPETASQNQFMSQNASKFWEKHNVLLSMVTTRRARAMCAVTLCRICLQDEKLAKDCIPVFARELRNNRDHIIRNNLIVGISDLCVRYTLMVDRYSTVMALCLTDASVFVRQQTITLLTNLIKEQFLKCEGQILYKLITTLIDDNKGIRDYLYFCLVEVLLVQFPGMFFNHFVECLFYFNGAKHQHQEEENEGQKDLGTQQEKKAYVYEHMKSNIRGRANLVQRMRLYKFMLGTMDDTKKFAIWARLIYEVCTPVSEGIMDYTKRTYETILIDTLNIFCCEEMKMYGLMTKRRDGDADENAAEEADQPQENVQENRATNLKATFLRAGIGEVIIPGLLSLKAFLTEKRSPMLKLVMNALMELVKDFEEQLDSFFASNRQAKAELLFDIRRSKEIEQEERDLREAEEAAKIERLQAQTRALSMTPNKKQQASPQTPQHLVRAASVDTARRKVAKRRRTTLASDPQKSIVYDAEADENPLADYSKHNSILDDSRSEG